MTADRYERIPEFTRGDRLRKARLMTGLSTREFAEKIGISPKSVNNAESDTHEARRIVLNAWAMATGVPAEWLESGTLSDADAEGGDSMTTAGYIDHVTAA